MDAFLYEIAQKLQEESASASKEIEPEFKQLSANTYSCVADCFRSPEPLSECQSCADKCNISINQSEQEINQNFGHIQNAFQICLQSCNLKINNLTPEENNKCITVCYNDAMERFAEFRKQSKDIMKKYL